MSGCPPIADGPAFSKNGSEPGTTWSRRDSAGARPTWTTRTGPGCNGRPYFVPCLLSHHPLDVVVVMLGTNDLKSCFDRPAKAIAEALHGYVDDIAANVADGRGRVPTTVLVSPIWIDDTAPGYAEVTGESFDRTGVARSRELADEIRRVATGPRRAVRRRGSGRPRGRRRAPPHPGLTCPARRARRVDHRRLATLNRGLSAAPRTTAGSSGRTS